MSNQQVAVSSKVESEFVATPTNQQQQQQVGCVQYNGKQYDRIRVLGKGSFGVASVHRRRADCSLVVFKEIDLQRFKGEKEKQAAINEARIMSTLSHVNIIKYYNAYTTTSKLIIEMEYASIGTLGAYLSFQVQPLEDHEILIIFRQIVSGLSYLHSMDIIHLDLKMANIFVTIEGLVKIGDFGIAQYLHSTDPNDKLAHTQVGGDHKSHLGTLTYSSPERCLGEPTDFKSDIWSLGCILYELIASKPMFAGDSLLDVVLNITRVQYQPIRRADVCDGLIETFEQMIARHPESRPSAADLLSITNQLISRTQSLHTGNKQNSKQVLSSRRQTGHAGGAFDLSTELALARANAIHDDVSQINYPHSLVYQVRLDSRNIHLDRVNLPQTKRIKGMSKGESHYLVLTYDNIVYGWGTKNCGQLGACGLTSSNATVRSASSSRSSAIYNSKPDLMNMSGASGNSSPSSSTQTVAISSIVNYSTRTSSSTPGQPHHLSKQLVLSMLKESQPASRPFIINELNHRKIIQVDAGRDFSVFLSKTGIVMTCGDGSKGCLGRGDLSSSYTPCMVESLLNTDVVSISCGPEHVVAVSGDGRAFAWGKNKLGRLGIGRGPGDSHQLNGDCESLNHSQRRRNRSIVSRPQPVLIPAGVLIKSVYCADKSTVFIDSENRCWACGENRFNKLGLDLKRRFKKDLIVDKCLVPSEIVALSKYKIIMCNIGKNHSSFITSEGKLIVFGQDIDHTYRLKSNIVCARDSHKKIALELQTKRHPSNQLTGRYNRHSDKKPNANYGSRNLIYRNDHPSSNSPSPINYKHLTQSTKLINSKHRNIVRGNSFNRILSSERKTPTEYKLNKLQRSQVDSYVSKSRAIKKMPFECVIKVSCTSKFTLALTSDNRVYFWGTRSYKKDGPTEIIKSQNGKNYRINGELIKSSYEPQLVASCSDQCFIKIGATNKSLMSSIQVLGSDHPIIHAQDPRLVAKSLADLWILDYRPIRSSLCSSASSSSSSSSSLIEPEKSPQDSVWHKQNSPNSSISSSSNCSLCRRMSSCSLCDCNNVTTSQNNTMDNNTTADEEDDYLNDSMKHAAILEPQPIHYTARQAGATSGSAATSQASPSTNRSKPIATKSRQPPSASLNPLDELPVDRLDCSSSKHTSRMELAAQDQTGDRSDKPTGPADGRNLSSSCISLNPKGIIEGKLANADQCNFNQPEAAPGHIDHICNQAKIDDTEDVKAISDDKMTLNNYTSNKRLSCCDSNNNHNCNNDTHTDGTAISSSQGGVSLEEPRSLSTFAATPSANHIIVGPTMLSSLNSHQQPMQPLLFGQSHQSQLYGNSLPCCGSPEAGAGSGSCDSSNSQQQVNPELSSRHRARRQTNRSESTTAFTYNDIDETSSMPSWVRNEYHQQKNSFQAGMFVADSSATEDTCMSELSVTTSSDANNGDSRDLSSSTTMASFNQNSVNLNATDILAEQASTPTIFEPHLTNISTSSPSSVRSTGLRLDSFDEQTSQVDRKPPTRCSDHELQEANWSKLSVDSSNNVSTMLDEYKSASTELLEDIKQQQQRKTSGLSTSLQNGKGRAGLSRSQPDISEHENFTGPGMMRASTRRASIILDGIGQAGSSNILQCGVYRVSSQHDASQLHYQSSSNFNSTISTRSNSHNLLIRPEPSSRVELCTNVSQQRISNGTSSPLTTQVTVVAKYQQTNGAVDAAYLWSKLHLSNRHNNIAPSNNELANIGGGVNKPSKKHQYQHLHLDGRQLSQSNQHLPLRSAKQNGSSSSLASLRKSLVKLFC